MNGTLCVPVALDRFAPMLVPAPLSRMLTPCTSQVIVTSYRSVGCVPPESGVKVTATIVPGGRSTEFPDTSPDASDVQSRLYLRTPAPPATWDDVSVTDPAMSGCRR